MQQEELSDGSYETETSAPPSQYRCNCDEKRNLEDLVQTGEGDRVCPYCGVVVDVVIDYSACNQGESGDFEGSCMDGTVYNSDPYSRIARRVHNRKSPCSTKFKPRAHGISYWQTRGRGLVEKGRYRHEFHWNERIAQLCLEDPPIPRVVEDRIEREAQTGKYGPCCNFTRADVICLLRDLNKQYPSGVVDPVDPEKHYKFITYRERWKKILYRITGQKELWPSLSPQLRSDADFIQKNIVRHFLTEKDSMPMSVLRTKISKQPVLKKRHNYMQFNFAFRAIMEIYGVYDFHWELPLVRSVQKLQQLNAVMLRISKIQGFHFTPAPVIKRAKFKK